MPMSPGSFNPAELRGRVLSLLWRQWSALGVPGAVQAGDRRILDPEALLIFTAAQARFDARLFDEVLAWTLLNEANLNLQRLSALLDGLPWGDTSVLGAIAAKVGTLKKSARWRKFAERLLPLTGKAEARALFVLPDGTPHPWPAEPDPDFLRYDWARPLPKLRRLTVAVVPGRTEALLFSLRGFFGIQARAEIFAWLLVNESGRPADIARATGHRPRTVETTLVEMAKSGQVLVTRAGRDRHYRIVRERWAFLLPDEGRGAQWTEWAPMFALLSRTLEVLDRPGLIPVLRATELKKVFEECAASLAGSGWMSRLTVSIELPAQEFATRLIKDLNALVAEDGR